MLVSLENVQLVYGQTNAVLTDINLRLLPGTFHFLTGPSGAGKSSLLRLIYGAEKPAQGTIKLFGQDLETATREEIQALRRRLGIVFQDFRLLPNLTALENAALPLRIAGAGPDQITTHVKELLHWVGLDNRMHAYPAELSGGEQQRVALARAIVNKPKLLLADEPTGNIDDESGRRMLHLLTELHKMGTAILLATHQQQLVERLNQPAYRLYKGRLLPRIAEVA